MTNSRTYYRSIRDDRDAWRDEMPQVCMCCGRKGHLEIHEIERKSQAPTRWAKRCNYLLLLNSCHAGPFASMEHARQLAFKLIRDPENFDLMGWLAIKDPGLRAPERVTMDEIREQVEAIQGVSI